MTVLAAAPLLLGLAGCADSTASGPTSADTTVDSYIAPGGQPPAAPPPVPPPAPPAPVVAPDLPPPPAGRPMTPGELQYRRACQAGTVQNGCQFYDNDNALRLQGIDPGES